MGKTLREKFQFRSEKRNLLAKAIKEELPALFEGKESPVHLDHCFARIVYDTVVQDDWRKHVKAPAIANFTDGQVNDGLEIIENIKREGAAYLAALDQQSLAYRNKPLKKKNPDDYEGKNG